MMMIHNMYVVDISLLVSHTFCECIVYVTTVAHSHNFSVGRREEKVPFSFPQVPLAKGQVDKLTINIISLLSAKNPTMLLLQSYSVVGCNCGEIIYIITGTV